ncbi:hypothetical protein E6O75_ATG04334 [Venturia nashicola]|uniref:Uncharacterized protein n=1 Tax=Venturia nashicola TaxID=86259 RepID=A0A4Z1PCV9_9PEZI|nr:hypothetical protein E6O75_ATG04334 [Venturia nashicola]
MAPSSNLSFRLLSLPLEIRYMIYRQTITPGLGYIDFLKTDGRPDLSLMLVNKQVCEEARLVLYRDVHIDLTFWDLDYRRGAWEDFVNGRNGVHWVQALIGVEDVFTVEDFLGVENFLGVEPYMIASKNRRASFEATLSGDVERDYAIGLNPGFVSRFRHVSFIVPIDSDHFVGNSYNLEAPDETHVTPDRDEHIAFFEQWHCLVNWFELFSAARRHNTRVPLRWKSAYAEMDYTDLQSMRIDPDQYSREDFEHQLRCILCRWKDYSTGITYLQEWLRTLCPEIDIGSENASKKNRFSITHEVVDDRITIGTMVEDAVVPFAGQIFDGASFKFDGLKLVDFDCNWR